MLTYLYVFLIGGAFCFFAHILIIRTKMTSSRILVLYVILGSLLEGVGLFKYIKDVGQSGATVPIVGFGALMTKGAITGAKTGSLYNMLVSPITVAAAGISAAFLSAYLMALLFKSKSKMR